jgi:hypothetical protein
MPPPAREYFTVDLRGLRAALAVRAARDGLTESDERSIWPAGLRSAVTKVRSQHRERAHRVSAQRRVGEASVRLVRPRRVAWIGTPVLPAYRVAPT